MLIPRRGHNASSTVRSYLLIALFGALDWNNKRTVVEYLGEFGNILRNE
jgi:hypothetical protein